GVANVDWNVSSKSALGLRYIHNDLGTNAFGANLPAFAVPGHMRSSLAAINYTATPTTTLTFNLNAAYNRLGQRTGGGNLGFSRLVRVLRHPAPHVRGLQTFG